MSLLSFDRNYRRKGYAAIAGVDEAGRGPWAGPVVAAAVILPEKPIIAGLKDSKKLTPKKREEIFENINRTALAVGIGIIDQLVIDSVNILQASYLAMKEALKRVGMIPALVLVDGYEIPELGLPQAGIIGGDNKSASIAAASIIAKVTRDRLMVEWSKIFPQYGFEKHKGYGTRLHQDALCKFGPCALHRKSFEPVRASLELFGNHGN